MAQKKYTANPDIKFGRVVGKIISSSSWVASFGASRKSDCRLRPRSTVVSWLLILVRAYVVTPAGTAVLAANAKIPSPPENLGEDLKS